MILENLRLVNFRSYEDELIKFKPDLELIVGPNGIGKTNILEAIYVLCSGNSFRLKKDFELIASGSGWARIEATFDLEGKKEKRIIKLSPGVSGASKKLEVDGVNRIASKNLLPVVLFEPDQLRMMTEGPDLRRSYLDERITFLDYDYGRTLSDYKRVIAQRNRLLKLIKKGEAKSSDLFIWHVKASELAAPIILKRQTYLNNLDEKLQDDYRLISKKKDELKVKYLPNFFEEDELKLSSRIFNKLESDVEKDILVGFTRTGPHRDDWQIELNGKDSAAGASRGEVRTILLSLKLYEFENLRDGFGITPLVLLDDVMSELDKSRRKELLSFFKEAQVIVSGVE